MNKEKKVEIILPSKAPFSLIVLAILFLFASLFITPKLLIYLGPMKESLTSEIELVRITTLVEVMLLRIFCLIAFSLIIFIIFTWKKFIQTKFIKQIIEHPLTGSDRQQSRKTIFNVSFIIMISFTLIVVLHIIFGNHYFEPSTLAMINNEDGIVEYLSAFLFLICSVISIIICFINSDNHNRKMIFIVFAIGFFFCFGEEISWGQRIFHFKTPELIREINAQNETNLHNLLGYFADHLFLAGVFFYCVILPLLKTMSPFWNRFTDKVGLPLPSLGLAISFLIVSLIQKRMIWKLIPTSRGMPVIEMRELLTSLGFLLLLLEYWNYSQQNRKPKRRL